MRSLSYGKASIEDLPRIVEMKLAMFEEAGFSHLLARDAASLVLSDYRQLYQQRRAIHMVARSSAEIVACAGAFVKRDLPFRYFDPPQYGFLGDVYTDSHYRGQGIATKLSSDAIGWLKGFNMKMVRLLASEATSSIYAEMGFKPSDEMMLEL
ncbi:MAG: GNAT family N-acetyltransferase [Candidatus Thiodiazotropha sp.]